MNLYFVAVGTLYVKATLYFPSCDLLWSFKDQTRGLNLHITLRKNTMRGLFLKQDLELAVQRFKANYTQEGTFLISHNVQGDDLKLF